MADEVTELRVTLARVEGKLDGLGSKLDGALATTQDHENRIRKIERMTYVAMGAAVVIGGTSGAVASMLTGSV